MFMKVLAGIFTTLFLSFVLSITSIEKIYQIGKTVFHHISNDNNDNNNTTNNNNHKNFHLKKVTPITINIILFSLVTL